MLSKQIVYLRDFAVGAEKLRRNYGYTNKFSTGHLGLDTYLGGGFGRQDGYEIVVLFGPTKIGKSFIALNFVKSPVLSGQKVGLMALEDAGEDVFIRFSDILGPDNTRNYIMGRELIHCMPQESLLKAWKLTELLTLIEEWFTIRKLDLILLDHLQFAFEGAEAIRGENEWITQRVFMQQLSYLMRRLNKTIILISHIGKDNSQKGAGKITGSSAIAGAATKLIEVSRTEGHINLHLWGSRFTKTPDYPYPMRLIEGKLQEMEEVAQDELKEIPF